MEDELISVGGPVEKVKVSLRIFGDDLEPDEVSAVLRCQPTSKTRKGEVVADDGKGHQRVSPFGSWLLVSEASEEVDLEEQVLRLLSRVVADPEVWRRLTAHYRVDLFCGVFLFEGSWNRGFALSPIVLKEMAARNLTIDFDIYAH